LNFIVYAKDVMVLLQIQNEITGEWLDRGYWDFADAVIRGPRHMRAARAIDFRAGVVWLYSPPAAPAGTEETHARR
jgi:hypothetical protein